MSYDDDEWLYDDMCESIDSQLARACLKTDSTRELTVKVFIPNFPKSLVIDQLRQDYKDWIIDEPLTQPRKFETWTKLLFTLNKNR